MALTDFRRQEVANSAFAIIGGAAGRLRPGEIAGRIIAKYGGMTDLGDQNTVLAIVRQQQAAFDQGAAMNTADALTPVTPSTRDWSLLESLGRYGYKVEVVLIDPVTGQRWRQLYVIESDTALSPSEVMERASRDARQNAATRRTNPVREGALLNIQITTRVVSAGRRP